MHPALKLILLKGVGVSFPISNLFAAGADGLDFAPLNTDGQYQSATGSVPANDPNEVIGFMPDRHSWAGQTLAQVLAAQTQLLTNPNFNTDVSGWTAINNATLTWAAGGAEVKRTDATASPAARQTASGLVVGRTYLATVDITANPAAASALMIAPGGNTGGATGTLSSIGAAAATTFAFQFGFNGSAGAVNDVITFDNASFKLVPGNHGVQATAAAKPKYQTAGAQFDALDDNELTAYVAQAGANCIVAYVDVPAIIGSTQVVAGALDASLNRCFLAFNTAGNLCAGVGSDSVSIIVGTTDWRGQTVVVALSFDGSTVKLFAETAEEYSAAQHGTPPTTIPFRIGALNNNSTASSFCGHFVKRVLAGRQAITRAQFKSIRTQILAGA